MNLYVLAFLIDLVVGDPHSFPHPIKFIGNFIAFMEKLLRKIFKSPKSLKFAGIILLISTIIFAMSIVYFPLKLLKMIGPVYYYIGVVYFSYTVISAKSLKVEAKKVKEALIKSLEEGRRQVGFIVGRDTAELEEEEVVKATIETVAENTTDGIIAPLIFLFIGGPILAMAFKGISTLDSMVGYQNEKYQDFGWASAKTDDVVNFIPARIAGLFMVIASGISGYSITDSFTIMKRDHHKHKSPNSAWTEASAAGALGIQLGGSHVYSGKEICKPTIGDLKKKAEPEDIDRMNKLMIATSALFVLVSWGISFLIIR